MVFNAEKMKNLMEKDAYIKFVVSDLINRGEKEEVALEVVYVAEVLDGNLEMQGLYIGIDEQDEDSKASVHEVGEGVYVVVREMSDGTYETAIPVTVINKPVVVHDQTKKQSDYKSVLKYIEQCKAMIEKPIWIDRY